MKSPILTFVVAFCLCQEIRALSNCCPGVRPCFNDDAPYIGLPLPECAELQLINMKVYTRQNPTDGQLITRHSIPSVFNGNCTTMFIVHGWLQNENSTWMHTMKDAVLAQVDYNVIIVGWGGGAQNPWYPQSASNTRAVGVEIALVSNLTIQNSGSSRSRQYCVGHSLGAHCCGHAGQMGQFGRMTGLDPAGPFFEGRNWTCGLNPSCADLVDVIHTNGGTQLKLGFGTLKPLGHVDFYPNGGSYQPGCVADLFGRPLNLEGILTLKNNTLKLGVDPTPGCSHFRSYELFIESIRTPCFLSRYLCSSQYSLPTSCSLRNYAIQSEGFDSNNYEAKGLFYLKTNSASPFCQK